jgi:hypothetical protein
VNAHSSGFGIVTMPSAIQAELQKTYTYLKTLDGEIRATPDIDAGFFRAWELFVDEFLTWYGDGGVWMFGSGPSTLWYSTYGQAQDYQRRAEEFRAKFVAMGGKTATSPKATPPEPPVDPEKLSVVKWVVAGVALVAIAYVAGPLVRGVGKKAGE